MWVIARTENKLMTKGCFFGACRSGNASNSYCHVQCNHHRGKRFVPLPTGVQEDVEVLGLYGVIQPAGYVQTLCFLTVCRSQEIDGLRYGFDNPQFLGYEFTTGSCYDVSKI